MAMVTLVTVIAAWYFYPKPTLTSESEILGNALFSQLDSQDVRWIKIAEYDPDTNAVKRIQLRYQRERWELPGKGNFPAGNANRIGALVTQLGECKPFRIMTEDQKDYELYGVIEPDETKTMYSGIGTMVSLEDQNNKSLASLIIGKPVKDSQVQRFVRIPGQPSVYVVDFNKDILNTRLAAWIDRNLLRISASTAERTPIANIQQIESDFYFVDPQEFNTGKYNKKFVYRIVLNNLENQWSMDLWKPQDNGSIEDTASETDLPASNQVLGAWNATLLGFPFVDVIRKKDLAASKLKAPSRADRPLDFESMQRIGFRHAGYENDQHQFDSVAGKVAIHVTDGQVIRLYFGTLVQSNEVIGGRLTRAMFMTSEVDPSFFQLDLDQIDQSLDEEEQRRQKLKLEQELAASQAAVMQRSREFNQVHSEWYYIIEEEVFEVLQPPLDRIINP